VLILPETDTGEALTAAENIREIAEELKIVHNKQAIGVTISSGVSTSPDHAVDKKTLLHAPNQALYVSKQTGKNRVSTS